MNIAIIGGGTIGSDLARAIAKANNGVEIADSKGGVEAAEKLNAADSLAQAADVAFAERPGDLTAQGHKVQTFGCWPRHLDDTAQALRLNPFRKTPMIELRTAPFTLYPLRCRS
nr:hypothetical protein [uncultured Celeribacter sp.]